MAEHGRVEYATATGNDYGEHERTYGNVIKLTKVGTISTLAVVVALGIFGTAGSVFWTWVGLILTAIATVIGLASSTGRVGPLVGVLVLLLVVWALLV